MASRNMRVLVVGATGSIGQLVVEEAIKQGHAVRALVRSASKARQLAREAESVVGDLTRPETLSAAVDGIDAIVFTHGRMEEARRRPRLSITEACATS